VQPLLEKGRLQASVSADGASTLVRADPARLWQILGNVIGNAIRHSPAGGRIAITVAEPATAEQGRPALLCVSVADEGPGVPDDERSRLFEPFYALPVGGKAAHGAGLGLAIVKQLVELHGGEVSLGNRQQGGACLTFSLPAAGAGGERETGG